jgi:elongation factor Ts
MSGTVSASDVGKLRAQTGAGLMDCKKALAEAGGDFEKAVDLIRKRGLQIAAKKAEREIKAGAVFANVEERLGAMFELGCETDFVARNDEFQALGKELAATLAKNPVETAAQLGDLASSKGGTIKEQIQAASGKSGENIQLGKIARFQAGPNGGVFHYLHFTGTQGALLELEGSTPAVVAHEETKNLAKELLLHIVFKKPLGLTRDSVPAEAVAREREVQSQSDALKGKPDNVIAKIVEGKMDAFFKEQVLLDQGFVKDEKKSIRALLDETGKKAGGKLEIKRFASFFVGGK